MVDELGFIKNELKKKGYPLENYVQALLTSKGWGVQPNAYFLDKDTGKGRELDMKATARAHVNKELGLLEVRFLDPIKPSETVALKIEVMVSRGFSKSETYPAEVFYFDIFPYCHWATGADILRKHGFLLNNRSARALNCIREHKQINQTKIAELLDVSNMTVSRMIGKLEAYGYIKRERGLHAEWLVSLA